MPLNKRVPLYMGVQGRGGKEREIRQRYRDRQRVRETDRVSIRWGGQSLVLTHLVSV